MKKLELLYAHEAWLKSSFDKGRYLRGDEVVGPDGKCQWGSHNVRVVGDLVILFTEAGCIAVCRAVQADQEFQWPKNAPAWANVILAAKDDMRMRIFAEDLMDGVRAVAVGGTLGVPGFITTPPHHHWIIVASRPGWVPERSPRIEGFRPEIAAAYYGAKSLSRMLVAAPAASVAHTDDAAVDRFATAMKTKLAVARAKGRSGWDDPAQCHVEYLANSLVEHVGKGNEGTFEDVANFAMMLHQRGADPRVLAEAAAPVAQGPFAVFKGGVFQSYHHSMRGAEVAATCNAGKNPGAVYTIYRPCRTIKGEITVKDI